jgi:hypothetical protein
MLVAMPTGPLEQAPRSGWQDFALRMFMAGAARPARAARLRPAASVTWRRRSRATSVRS